ncbi:MAG: hypothetical protein RSC24_06590 [Clostridium sp.]
MNGIVIQNLPLSNSVNDDDFLLLEQYSGTKKIKAREFKEFLADTVKVENGTGWEDILKGTKSILKYRGQTVAPVTLANAVYMTDENKTILDVIGDLNAKNTLTDLKISEIELDIVKVKDTTKDIQKQVDEVKNAKLNTIRKTNVLDDCELAPMKLNDFNQGAIADLMFYVPDNKNQQGLAYAMEHFYVGFDVGSGNGEIIKYTKSGKKIATTGSLVLGHCAELDFRESNGNFYVCNGGGSNPTKVYEVDFDNKRVVKTMDLSQLGNSALICINNDIDEMILSTTLTGGDNGQITFSFVSFNGTIGKQFKIPTQGIPQGLEYYNGIIYYYTNNKITCIDMNGSILGSFKINKKGESEGLAVAFDNGFPYLVVGYNGSNRIYAIRPFEAQKMMNLQLLNPLYSNGIPDKQLLPRMLSFAIAYDNATKQFSIADWGNGVVNTLGGIVNRVENNIDNVKIYLNIKFDSTAFFTANPDPQLVEKGVSVAFNLEKEGNELTVKFYKGIELQNINSLPNYSDVRCIVIGGLDIGY